MVVLDGEEMMQKVWGGHGTGSGEDTGRVPQRVGSLGPISCLSVCFNDKDCRACRAALACSLEE